MWSSLAKEPKRKAKTQAFIATCTSAFQLLHGRHLLLGKLDKVIFGQGVQLRTIKKQAT